MANFGKCWPRDEIMLTKENEMQTEKVKDELPVHLAMRNFEIK